MRSSKIRLLSNASELDAVARLIHGYVRLPFSPVAIPGAVVEGVLGHVRRAEVLRTYDFVDVVDREKKIAWQVKSTLAGTPITWKRVKLEGREGLIAQSERSTQGVQALGDAIMGFCNEHARKSFERYDLSEIGYARLIVHPDGTATYFERQLCTRDRCLIFRPEEFKWSWSKKKETTGKEQLSALHGTHIPTGKKWFAWHGRGENQLHFSGESNWWPTPQEPGVSKHFKLPSAGQRLSMERFVDLLARAQGQVAAVKRPD